MQNLFESFHHYLVYSQSHAFHSSLSHIYRSGYCAAIQLLCSVDVIFCYGDISIRAIVIHSPLWFILSLLDRPFIYLCHLFHSTPHVFFIMLLFSAPVSLFLFCNYQYAKARFTMNHCWVSVKRSLQLCFSLKPRDIELNLLKGEMFCKAF